MGIKWQHLVIGLNCEVIADLLYSMNHVAPVTRHYFSGTIGKVAYVRRLPSAELDMGWVRPWVGWVGSNFLDVPWVVLGWVRKIREMK